MLPRLVALSGWRGSGKDTTAAHLVQKYGYRQLSFAAKLKDQVAGQFGVPRDHLDSPTHKESPLSAFPVISTDTFSEVLHNLLRAELASGYWTPRALCILIGSLHRSVDPNHWVRTVAREVIDNPNQNYVISDMRYKSEADTLRILIPQLVTVRINRFETINTTEASERDLDNYKFDIQLSNTGSIERLHDEIDNHITSISEYHLSSVGK